MGVLRRLAGLNEVELHGVLSRPRSTPGRRPFRGPYAETITATPRPRSRPRTGRSAASRAIETLRSWKVASIERCGELRGAARKGPKGVPAPNRKADLAALAALDGVGVSKETLRALGEQVAVARTVEAAPGEIAPESAQDPRIDTLRQIHAWYVAWTDVARSAITSRTHLVQLGQAKRRTRKAKPAPAVPPIDTVEANGPDSRSA